ncbi:MBL fold metallo-hydrolase [Singulisphaera sp. PoT]|uniref:MBL fold metallo-hydrolase n=1 Tax=Singulisphaera sp. PoT TaxID=3411797 RepID=UPI003BF4F33A
MNSQEIEIVAIESDPFGEMSYVVWLKGRSDAFVIDPGFDAQSILQTLQSNGLRLAAILNTHGHVDHIAGNGAMKAEFPEAPLVIGRNEAHLLTDPQANLSGLYGFPIVSPEADRLLDEGERVEFAGIEMEVREIPGHSPGSIVLVCDRFEPVIVFGGDVLFLGSVGRTDLGGNAPLLFSGIRSKLFNLPGDTRVLPGHGPETTVAAERRSNPFVGDQAGLHGIGRS